MINLHELMWMLLVIFTIKSYSERFGWNLVALPSMRPWRGSLVALSSILHQINKIYFSSFNHFTFNSNDLYIKPKITTKLSYFRCWSDLQWKWKKKIIQLLKLHNWPGRRSLINVLMSLMVVVNVCGQW